MGKGSCAEITTLLILKTFLMQYLFNIPVLCHWRHWIWQHKSAEW